MKLSLLLGFCILVCVFLGAEAIDNDGSDTNLRAEQNTDGDTKLEECELAVPAEQQENDDEGKDASDSGSEAIDTACTEEDTSAEEPQLATEDPQLATEDSEKSDNFKVSWCPDNQHFCSRGYCFASGRRYICCLGRYFCRNSQRCYTRPVWCCSHRSRFGSAKWACPKNGRCCAGPGDIGGLCCRPGRCFVNQFTGRAFCA